MHKGGVSLPTASKPTVIPHTGWNLGSSAYTDFLPALCNKAGFNDKDLDTVLFEEGLQCSKVRLKSWNKQKKAKAIMNELFTELSVITPAFYMYLWLKITSCLQDCQPANFCHSHTQYGIQLSQHKELTWLDLAACAMMEFNKQLTMQYYSYFKETGFTDAEDLANNTVANPEVSYNIQVLLIACWITCTFVSWPQRVTFTHTLSQPVISANVQCTLHCWLVKGTLLWRTCHILRYNSYKNGNTVRCTPPSSQNQCLCNIPWKYSDPANSHNQKMMMTLTMNHWIYQQHPMLKPRSLIKIKLNKVPHWICECLPDTVHVWLRRKLWRESHREKQVMLLHCNPKMHILLQLQLLWKQNMLPSISAEFAWKSFHSGSTWTNTLSSTVEKDITAQSATMLQRALIIWKNTQKSVLKASSISAQNLDAQLCSSIGHKFTGTGKRNIKILDNNCFEKHVVILWDFYIFLFSEKDLLPLNLYAIQTSIHDIVNITFCFRFCHSILDFIICLLFLCFGAILFHVRPEWIHSVTEKWVQIPLRLWNNWKRRYIFAVTSICLLPSSYYI